MKKRGLHIRSQQLLSQQDLADFLFLSRSHINMFEQGKRSLPTAAMERLAQLESAWVAAGQEPVDPGKKQGRKAVPWDKSRILKGLSKRVEKREWKLKGFEDQLNRMRKEHQQLLRWREVLEKFPGKQSPGKREGTEKWLGFYLLKIQKKIEAVGPEKQFLLQFSIDTLKAGIRVAGEAKEKLRLL